MAENQCPFCRSETPSEASKCSHCLSVIGEYKICPDCVESVSAQAKACKFCGYRWPTAVGAPGGETEVLSRIWANNIGAMINEPSFTALFLPPELTLTRAEAVLVKWSFLGLRTYRQRISTDRIASVRFLQGIFWGGIVIETYGGSSSDLVVTGLPKGDAKEMADLLDGFARKGATR